MQFSESWLRSLCNPPLTTDGLCHVLTMAGLEVEEVKPVAPVFSGVVVAQVLTVEKHPNADKLNVCTVDAGQGEALHIVCGAPNVAVGIKVPCATVGASLPGMDIKQAKVRGLDSFGMLCSARELGIAEDHGGLLVLPAEMKVGENIRTALNLDDHLITLKLTPNRADCFSLLGIARELSALTGAPLTLPELLPVTVTHSDRRTLVLDAPSACPRYCGRIVRGVNALAPTPERIKQRIERSGIRAISAAVDITNYVMLELGQPLHAFDNAKLSGAIHVRYPKAQERLILLNGMDIEPQADMTLIADEQQALALAGVMGGEASSVTGGTADIFLESAFFAPVAIAGKARTMGFSSDASHRFERGVDFNLPQQAIERATELIIACCGGQAGEIVEAVSAEHLPTRLPVILRVARVSKVLGIEVSAERATALLSGLGLQVEPANGQEGHLLVTPPSFRFDIEIEEDLIEEIARLHGYGNIPSNPPVARATMMPAAEFTRNPMQVRHAVAARDYHEIVTYSFVEAAWEKDFANNADPIELANPIANQMSVMRSTLIGGLVDTLVTNRKRQTERVRIFELGRCFSKSDDTAKDDPSAQFSQPLRVAGLAAGLAAPEQWGIPSRRVDFYDVKADVEALFSPEELRFVPMNHPALHPGRCAEIFLGDQSVGVLGELHPRWVQKYALGQTPIVFELALAQLMARPFIDYKEVSRFPMVVRDLALVLEQSQPALKVRDALRAAAPALVRDIVLFDVYQGQGLLESQKSLAFHIVMQDTQRTLEDVEIEEIVSNLLQIAQKDFGAVLR